jgi:hypothetical protein
MRLRTIIAGAVAAALLVWPAYAQQDDAPKPEQLEKKRNAERLDQQYHNALERTSGTTAPAKTDPWENMRAPADSKAKK